MGWECGNGLHLCKALSKFPVSSYLPVHLSQGREVGSVMEKPTSQSPFIVRPELLVRWTHHKLNGNFRKISRFRTFRHEKLLSFFSPSEFPVRLQIYSIKNFRILPKIKRLNANNLDSFIKIFLFMMIKYTNYFLEVIYHSKLIYFTELASETV